MKMVPFFPDKIVKKYSKDEKLILVFTTIKNVLTPILIEEFKERITGYNSPNLHITRITCQIQNLENKLNILKTFDFELKEVSIEIIDENIKVTCGNFECIFPPDMILEIENRFKKNTK